MRTDDGAMFHPIQGSELTAAIAKTADPTLSPPATIQRSPCHSPVLYLFTGIVVMLGVIVFALLVLACSYWKLSGGMLNDEANGGRIHVEGGGGGKKGERNSEEKALPVSEEKFLVIMAGEMKPTFLATPTSSCSGVTSCNG